MRQIIDAVKAMTYTSALWPNGQSEIMTAEKKKGIIDPLSHPQEGQTRVFSEISRKTRRQPAVCLT
jgi:hypothetical protein